MKWLRNKFVTMVLRMLGEGSSRQMKEKEIKRLLNHLAEDPEIDNILLFLNNCADVYKNQFLYTADPFYKGMVTAFVVLKDKIIQAKPENRNKKSVLDKVKGKIKY